MVTNFSVHCITLSTRDDRKSKFKKWANEIDQPWSNLTKNVNFCVADPDPNGGDFGCWKSHMRVIKSASDAGSDWALIFEDDATPTNAARDRERWVSIWSQIVNLTQTSSDWDVIGLGGIPMNWWYKARQVSQNIIQTPFLEAHAYLVSAKFMDRMLSIDYTGTYDSELVRRATSTSYIITPELFIQDGECGSDLSLQNVIAFRNGYKSCVWGWSRLTTFPARSACLVAASALILLNMSSVLPKSRISKVAVFMSSAVLITIFVTSEYAQDCYSGRYRRSLRRDTNVSSGDQREQKYHESLVIASVV